ncbi:hypothetical protein [Actinoplanes sp. NBRC 103695]|uniref:polysaccharide biosynthesis C-terminal domain-containing protein n=1 Tax=Actinoplanes sp. NBRC 103695 TaxID=3032202 RepID=UPI0024A353C7|nr:hypothetical protein [Actinoplanes sp. NBRC 103695]GLY95361.1 hypothetical protein Acsp02_26160 [Actinoplanes sp. NBRC 103695]
MDLDKVSVRHLVVSNAPAPADGGIVRGSMGEIAQIVNGDAFRFLAFIEFAMIDGGYRGNHYHLNKIENLYVISGRLKAFYHDLDTDETASMELKAGDLVKILPRCAHVYFPLEHSQAVEFGEEPFDPSDTIRYVVTDGPEKTHEC